MNHSSRLWVIAVLLTAFYTAIALADAPATQPATTQASEVQKLADEMVAVGEKMQVILATVKDPETAQAAVPKLEAMYKPVGEIVARVTKLPKADQAAVMNLANTHPRTRELQEQAMRDMQTIQANPEIKKILDPVFQRMPGFTSEQAEPAQ